MSNKNMKTENRAFPPFRVPGGVAIARRRHFPKYLVNSDTDSDTDSDDLEAGPIGCVIVVELPGATLFAEGGVLRYSVFTIFGNNFPADYAEVKDLFFKSKPGQELYLLYTTTFKEAEATAEKAAESDSFQQEFKEPHQFMDENIEIAKFLYVKALGKITLVHDYTVGGYYSNY
jgi:hypothetical protein